MSAISISPSFNLFEKDILIAGGKISCHRCQAKSKRTKLQCGRPALRGKNVCDFHGGRSTGPKTEEGKARSRQAQIKSGEYTQEFRLQLNCALLNFAYIEDMMHMLKMTSANRTRGPKPNGYLKLTSLTELMKAIEANQNTKPARRTTTQKQY